MKISDIEFILKNKLIIIIRGIATEKLIPLTEALYKGGIRLVEVTYDACGIVSDEKTSEQIKMLAEYFKNRMLIGAGTVLTAEQVELTAKAGGKFIISPDTNVEVIEKTNELGLVSIPGALTPSEITLAHRAGADFVKLFPVNALGSEYIKAIKAPLSHIRMLAVGGVNPDNIFEYNNVGVCGFGVGSSIIDKKSIDADRFDVIAELAKKYLCAAGVENE